MTKKTTKSKQGKSSQSMTTPKTTTRKIGGSELQKTVK